MLSVLQSPSCASRMPTQLSRLTTFPSRLTTRQSRRTCCYSRLPLISYQPIRVVRECCRVTNNEVRSVVRRFLFHREQQISHRECQHAQGNRHRFSCITVSKRHERKTWQAKPYLRYHVQRRYDYYACPGFLRGICRRARAVRR